MSTEFELIKIVAQSIVSVREDGRVVDEVVGQQIACYGPDALVSCWGQAEREVALKNAEVAAESRDAAANGDGDGDLDDAALALLRGRDADE